MKPSVSIHKVSPVHLRRIVSRPRLLNLIEKNKDKKVTLILGRAAQGKTTLAASYVKRSKIPSAWVTLDADDSDPATLFGLIVQSLQYSFKDTDWSHLLSYSKEVVDRGQETRVCRDWAKSIFERLSVPIQLIIDGLDLLSSDAPALGFLQILIEEAPPNIRFIMLSRGFPPLNIDRLKMKEEAVVLGNDELAFTKSETKEFLKKRDITLEEWQLERVYSSTEGWVGGVFLFSEYLNGLNDPLAKEKALSDLPLQLSKESFHFFGTEIFSAQSQEVQQLLIQSSILDVIEPGLMKDLIGIENASRILEDLARRNLFVQSAYDDQGGRLYRYHPLFRRFLNEKVQSELGDKERKALLLKAGQLYEKKNELEKAMKYFLEINAYPQAVSILERIGMDIYRQGRRESLSRWIRALPKAIIQKNPWLLLFQALTNRFMTGGENVIPLKRALALFDKRRDPRGQMLSLAQFLLMMFDAGIIPKESLIKKGEALIQSSDWVEYQYEKAILLYCLGLNYGLVQGDIEKGIVACRNAYTLARQFNDDTDHTIQVYALSFILRGLVLKGELSLANDTCKKIEKILEKKHYPEARVVYLIARCLLSIRRGDFVKASDLAKEIQKQVEDNGFVFISPWTYELSGYLMLHQKNLRKALEIGKAFWDLAGTLENPMFKGRSLRLLGLIYLNQGDLEKAEEAVYRAKKIFSGEFKSNFELNRLRVVIGLVCLEMKQYKTAEGELNKALQHFSTSNNHAVAMIQFVMALLKWDQGMIKETILHLKRGFEIAEEKKYDYFYTLNPKYLKRICLLAIELKVSGAMDHAAHLLSSRFHSVAAEDLEDLSIRPDPRIVGKIREIRRAVYRSNISQLRIKTLGGFRVSVNGSFIEEPKWVRNQPRRLLKSIVAHGGQGVPVNDLIDDLWPKAEGKAGERGLKVTLHRLRKILEPTVRQEYPSTYIRLKEGLISLDLERCRVDIDEFLRFIKKGKEEEKKGEIREALSFYGKAEELYEGDFLQDEVLSSAWNAKRGELRRRYIELLFQLATLYEKQGALKKATSYYMKILQIDPLIEGAYRKLMILYSNNGMRNDAIRLYENYKRNYSDSEMWKPDPFILSIYNKISENAHQP